jgi:hypothetical protein
MILFNAALVGAYWERPRERLLEQRQVAGREPPSEQRSEGQPGYLEESLLHLHLHRAPITATQPMDIPLTGSRATRSRATHSRAMDIQATRVLPVTPVPRPMATQATQATPVLRAMDTQATRDTQPTPVPRPLDTRAARHTLPIPVLVMEIRWLVIPAIALRRTGRLEPSTVSSLLAEFRHEIDPQSSTPLVAARTNASVKRLSEAAPLAAGAASRLGMDLGQCRTVTLVWRLRSGRQCDDGEVGSAPHIFSWYPAC